MKPLVLTKKREEIGNRENKRFTLVPRPGKNFTLVPVRGEPLNLFLYFVFFYFDVKIK